MVDNLRIGQVGLGRRDVRRVADDQVEAAVEVCQTALGAVQVQVDLGITGRDPEGGVAPRPLQRLRVPLDGVHGRAGDLVGQRERDRAAAGAQVHAERVRPALPPYGVDSPLHHRLGLGPRDEHPWSDGKLEVAEADGAGEVLQRDPLRATGHQLPEGRGLHRVQLVEQHQLRGLGQAEDVYGQRPGVVLGRRHAGSVQLLPGRPDRRPQGAHPGPCSLAVVSASTSDWMTASRSPSSTEVRLLAL